MTDVLREIRDRIFQEHACRCEVCTHSAGVCPATWSSLVDELAERRLAALGMAQLLDRMRQANQRLQGQHAALVREHDALEEEAAMFCKYNGRLVETLEQIGGEKAREKLEAMLQSEAFLDGGRPLPALPAGRQKPNLRGLIDHVSRAVQKNGGRGIVGLVFHADQDLSEVLETTEPEQVRVAGLLIPVERSRAIDPGTAYVKTEGSEPPMEGA